MRHADFVRLGGAESVEVIMWLAMRGALPERVHKIHQSYYLPMTTAMTVVVFEESAAGASIGNATAHAGMPSPVVA